MADYWIKWYHEILDDPKMATLPDRLWRRFSELCLLSGRLFADKTGELPDAKQIAWALRMPVDDLKIDMDQLATDGFVRKTKTGYTIVNFEKRQKAATSTERSKQSRQRKQHEQYHDDATGLQRNVAQSRADTEQIQSRAEQSSSSDDEYGELARAYERNIGALTGMIGETLDADLKEYGLALCLEAMNRATRNNVQKWSYVQGILKRLKSEGYNDKPNKSEKKQTGKVTIKLPDGQLSEANL